MVVWSIFTLLLALFFSWIKSIILSSGETLVVIERGNCIPIDKIILCPFGYIYCKKNVKLFPLQVNRFGSAELLFHRVSTWNRILKVWFNISQCILSWTTSLDYAWLFLAFRYYFGNIFFYHYLVHVMLTFICWVLDSNYFISCFHFRTKEINHEAIWSNR